ncbi:uncharacterized protein si:ch211-67e16.4 isoform X2 [Betta splendens]|uniref:Uncharacterized protein si:ch211-67e16.4 isoform X2 n=1 Tax=Betta splendens TaxID=158456 RepID=A0A9W2XGR4_BETSP|nr:uncharacterized protein si:ch211-67e16.4 isoform X2 [Betta splendens]
MDVSIAVSLIRGQMGTVVERAVNGAVETVLAEMLKVVGVKFEELKSQVVVLKRDISTLQREKALKEKENDNIRAKLRYTELKLKYYRQGVEEELQQRASAAALVRIHPPSLLQTQKGGAAVSPTGATASRLPQPRTTEIAVRRNQECSSSQSTSCHAVRAPLENQGVATADSSNLQLPVSLPVITPADALDSSTVLFSPTEPDATKSKADQDDCEWTITLHPHTECVDPVMVPPPAETLGQPPVAGSVFLDGSTQADSSTLPPTTTQVKQEAQQPQEEEEVICIKEEPEEEQEVTATLLLDCQEEQDHLAESEAEMQTATHWSGLPANHTNHTTVMSSAEQNTYPLHQMVTSIPSMVALQPGIPPRQAVRPWTKDLSLYEEYKLRRNELRRRNLSRRRELEKSLPQPLLADLEVRERREKTRLRVARWRAKRKLQACLNQAQAQGVAADVSVSPTGFPISSQHEGVRLPYASTSSTQPGSARLNSMSAANISATLPFKASTPSSNLLHRGTNMSAHEHTVTSSSPYPQGDKPSLA